MFKFSSEKHTYARITALRQHRKAEILYEALRGSRVRSRFDSDVWLRGVGGAPNESAPDARVRQI